MTPQELKNSILQQAIQGRLVEQRPEEGTAEELYQQIQAEKQRLIKEKKIKKDKPLPEITEEEKPFEIPESWKWVRLHDIMTKITDGTHHSPANGEVGEHLYISAKNIKEKGVMTSNATYVTSAVHEEIYARCDPEYGDILLIKDGATTGIATVNNITEPFSMLSSVALLKVPKILNPWYIVYALRSDLFYKILRSQMKGTGITRITLTQIYPMLVPLPPLAEQKRIVAKIEKLQPLIDRYEAAWTKLEAFNKRFPEDMQKSILQQAIQGKLVEQRPEEGSGEELYQQIQAEKQALIKAKKIKKDKPLPEITEEEKPFDIPENWKWVRLGTLVETITSGSRDWAKFYSETGDIFLRMGNLSRNSFQLRLDKIQHVTLPDTAEGMRTVLMPGDLLFSITGEVGMLGLIPEDLGTAYINQHTAMIRFMSVIKNRYIPYLLLTDYAQKLYQGHQHGIKNSFRLDSIAYLPIPLPPLAEQKRIVAKIEQLLPLCELLKS